LDENFSRLITTFDEGPHQRSVPCGTKRVLT